MLVTHHTGKSSCQLVLEHNANVLPKMSVVSAEFSFYNTQNGNCFKHQKVQSVPGGLHQPREPSRTTAGSQRHGQDSLGLT